MFDSFRYARSKIKKLSMAIHSISNERVNKWNKYSKAEWSGFFFTLQGRWSNGWKINWKQWLRCQHSRRHVSEARPDSKKPYDEYSYRSLSTLTATSDNMSENVIFIEFHENGCHFHEKPPIWVLLLVISGQKYQ